MLILLGRPLGCVRVATAAAQGPSAPQAPPAPEATLPPVFVTAPPPLASSSEQLIPDTDFELRPQGQPADVLRLIPGLIINQHQTGGKAEQCLGNRFADPDRHHTARGYTLFNWTGRYRYQNAEAFPSIENLTETDWREAQFLFTSRLPGEPAGGVPDIHFTPGTPRAFLGGLAIHF
jgi:hypothetical protein